MNYICKTEYQKSVLWEFITNPAVDIDAEWDRYVAKLEQIGLPDIIALEQSVYDRYNEN